MAKIQQTAVYISGYFNSGLRKFKSGSGLPGIRNGINAKQYKMFSAFCHFADSEFISSVSRKYKELSNNIKAVTKIIQNVPALPKSRHLFCANASTQ